MKKLKAAEEEKISISRHQVSITFVLIVHLVLWFSGVERSAQRLPLQSRLTVLLNILQIQQIKVTTCPRQGRTKHLWGPKQVFIWGPPYQQANTISFISYATPAIISIISN